MEYCPVEAVGLHKESLNTLKGKLDHFVSVAAGSIHDSNKFVKLCPHFSMLILGATVFSIFNKFDIIYSFLRPPDAKLYDLRVGGG